MPTAALNFLSVGAMLQSRRTNLKEPLLSKEHGAPSLAPLRLYVLALCTSGVIGMVPAFALRFRELAADAGLDEAMTAATLGRVTACRSVAEFFASPVLALWSDRVGRRPIIMLCVAAVTLEFAALGVSKSLGAFSTTYVVFGLLTNANGTLEGACIADATPAGSARAAAFGRLFAMIGMAMSVGPMIGGYLAGIDGRLTFKVASFLCACVFVYVARHMPEYLQHAHRSADPGVSSTPGFAALCSLVKSSPCLMWYAGANVFYGVATGAYSSSVVIWLREAFGWEGRGVGLFMSASGIELMVAQGVLLPRLLKALQGREALLAKLGLLTSGAKYAAYSVAPSGAWLVLAQVVGTLGTCAAAPLRSLSTQGVPESQQGALSGALAALMTIANIHGSLVGSHVLAESLRSGAHPGQYLLVSAAASGLAAMCVEMGTRT